MCDYQTRWFGAWYEDGACIEGYMWDLDSCHVPGGPLYHGGSDPCPKCNTSEFLFWQKENAEGGYSDPRGAGVEWEAAISVARDANPEETDRVLREVIKEVRAVLPDDENGNEREQVFSYVA